MRIISFHACVTRGSIDHDDINVHLDAVNVRLSLKAAQDDDTTNKKTGPGAGESDEHFEES